MRHAYSSRNIPFVNVASVFIMFFVGGLSWLHAASNYATPYIITTLAGTAGTSGSTDGTGALFNGPYATAVDGSGNVYVADSSNDTIRKITPAGVVSTLAGTAGVQGSNDGTGSAAQFTNPFGVAVDANGNVYVADLGNNTIRKITPAGGVTTLAGSASNAGSNDGTGAGASFFHPTGIAVDGSGNLYVSDAFNDTIRKVTPDGGVTTLAGQAGTNSRGSTDGTGSAARFNSPAGVAVDGSGNVYVADGNNATIRKITPDGGVTTLVGTAGSFGSTDGTGSAALFNNPFGVAVDGTGNIYVTDNSSNTIRKITPDNGVTTLAGTAGTSGATPGTGPQALFNGPAGVAVDGNGNIYVADSGNNTIRKGTPTYAFTNFAGSAGYSGSADGTGIFARFYGPNCLAIDGSGTLYVADAGNSTIRKITPGGVVSTLAGTAGQSGSADGSGGAALFSDPFGVALDGSGNLYVADYYNNNIRKITPGGVVSTLAGLAGQTGSTDGSGSAARFNGPAGVAVDQNGNVYVADYGNATIRVITSSGVVTLAGVPGQTGSTDGTGSAALFGGPAGLAVDGSGNLYLTDFNNDNIRKITPDGGVTTLAGLAGHSGNADGSGSAARFYGPEGVTLDGSGNLYVADQLNNAIRKIAPAGLVTTISGNASLFSDAAGVALDGSGNLYVSNYNSSNIVKGTPPIPLTPPLDAFGGVVTGVDLKRSAWFGHYSYSTYPLVYEYYLGYEYTFPTNGGVYLYDYSSGHFWYTQSSYFPFIYDFGLNAFLYYYQANTPHRHFYDFGTNAIISE